MENAWCGEEGAATAETRDIIVIGASWGGITALSTLVGALPADLPAAVLVVQHVSPDAPDSIAAILARSGPLPACTAVHGTVPEPGRIYVAPPDRHLLLTDVGLVVGFGPRENRSRPAIDPLFRTAAVHYRSRVIGVVLTGLLSDGAAGLLAVRRCGGLTVVQAPGDAESRQMPESALRLVPDALQAPLAELGTLLARLAREPAPEPPAVPAVLKAEAQLTERAMESEDWGRVPGQSTDFTCPECNGALRRVDENGTSRFICRVGHAFNSAALLAAKDEAVEQSLWVALQTLQERVQMLEAMASEDRARGRERSAASLDERGAEARGHAERLRAFILRLAG